MSDRRKIVAETIRDYQARHMVVCEHTQLISFGGCADAVLAALDEHDAAEVERLRRAYNALTADRNRLAAQVRDLAAQGGRERDERDEARAEVERLRAELVETAYVLEVTGEKLTAIRGQRDRAETERDRLTEQVKRAQDPDLIRRAIADPGAYVKRKLDHGEPAETVPAWGARAVIAALGGTEAGQ